MFRFNPRQITCAENARGSRSTDEASWSAAAKLREAMRPGARSSLGCLQGLTILTIAYLCAGELLPVAVIKRSKLLQGWAVQQVLLLAVLSCLAVLASASWSSSGGRGYSPGGPVTAASLLAALNIVAVLAAALATPWWQLSDNCPVAPGEDCDYLAIVLDTIGLISARLARLDLGVSLLLATRGESAWLLGATGGMLGYAEAISLHRAAGW